MRVRIRSAVTGAALACAVGGCASSGAETDGSSRSPGGNSATVISGDQLSGRGGDLLRALASRYVTMQVETTAGCPEIVIRGRKSMSQRAEPGIYVDGNRAADTCILGLISPADVERVEIYPMGVAPDPGYRMNPAGLILVFTRRGGR